MGGKYNRKDHLYNRAKDEGYRGRAAYKLLELQKKYKLIRPGSSVLDMGCFPGGWLQVASGLVGDSGLVVGVDLKDIEKLSNDPQTNASVVTTIIGDVRDDSTLTRIQNLVGGSIDVLLSDMSPSLSGVRFRDICMCAELVECAADVADKLLRAGGSFVAKIFPGPETDELYGVMKKRFKRFERAELKSTRQTSNEFYFVGQGFLGPTTRG